MTQSPVRPTYRPAPEGFVDAIGLDDDLIPVTPFIVGARQPLPAEAAAERSKPATRRRSRRRRGCRADAPASAPNHDLVMDK